MDYTETYSRHRAVVREVHADYRQSKYWNPLKRYASRMVQTAIFLTVVASVALAGAQISGAFFIN